MTKSYITVFAIIISIIFSTSIFAGCGKKQESLLTDTKKVQSTTQNKTTGSEELTLPIVTKPITLTYYTSLNVNVAATMKNYNDVKMYQELEKRTGIHIEFKHPPIGQESEQFKLMIAANDLPDIIAGTWLSYPGGPEKAISDGVGVKLNDAISQYAPNFSKLLADNPEVRKEVSTDAGSIMAFPELCIDPGTRVSYGPQIRKDWLDKLGLKVPVTVDDWYTVLKAFKEKDPNGNGKADEIPFISVKPGGMVFTTLATRTSFILGTYGLAFSPNTPGLYLKDGKVAFAPIQPEFKEYLTVMRKWYKEGLIDQDYATTDSKGFDAKITSGKAGAWLGWLGSTMGNNYPALQKNVPDAKIAGTTNPVLKAGQRPIVGHYISVYGVLGHVITSKCKYVKEAVKWFDYKYGKEGDRLSNWGLEGEGFTLENGKPKYSDLILNNPKGLPVSQAAAQYTLSQCNPPTVQDKDAFMQRYILPEQREALKLWADADNKILFPNVTYTPEESKKATSISINLITYMDEMMFKFVMGVEPLENYDKFVQALKGMEIDEYLKLSQAALDRYNNRK